MVKRAIIAIFIAAMLLSSTHAAQPDGTVQLGVRIGVLSNSQNELEVKSSEVKLFGNKTNPYIEGFVEYFVVDFLALTLNLASYSKGDIRFDIYVNGVFDGSFLGQASIYPIQAGIKLSPFSTQFPLNLQPYLTSGGVLVIGREQATLGPYDSYWAKYSDGTIGSEIDFGWWVGGGVEIPLSKRFQLDFMAKQFNTVFSGDIAGIKDYSGIQVTVGIGYLYK